MKALIQNLHFFVILYALFSMFMTYEEKTEVVENKTNELQGIRGRKIKIDRELAQVNKFRKDLEKSKMRIKEVIKQIDKAQKQLPNDQNEFQVATDMVGLMKDLKLQSPNLRPQSEVLNGFYFTKDYSLSAKGTFLQSLVFFENLLKSERLFNVKEITIRQQREPSRGRFQILELQAAIESYRYNSSYKGLKTAKEIDETFSVP